MIVKICGLRTEEAVRAAAGAGADLLGFIFYQRSRRYIEPEKVKEAGPSNIETADVVGMYKVELSVYKRKVK